MRAMVKPISHPDADQIELSAVLDALSDPIRREIVLRLSEAGELRCGAFGDTSSKTNLTYHLARLREAGILRIRCEGACRWSSLRTDELDGRFPGLLRAVLDAARLEGGSRLGEALVARDTADETNPPG